MFDVIYDLNASIFMRKKSFYTFDYIDGGIYPVFGYITHKKDVSVGIKNTYAPASIDSFKLAINKLSQLFISTTSADVFEKRLKIYFKWFKFPPDELKNCLAIFKDRKEDILYNGINKI